jgi:hypothetical protein
MHDAILAQPDAFAEVVGRNDGVFRCTQMILYPRNPKGSERGASGS